MTELIDRILALHNRIFSGEYNKKTYLDLANCYLELSEKRRICSACSVQHAVYVAAYRFYLDQAIRCEN